MAITRDDNALQVAVPVIFHGFGHRSRGFACAYDNSAAFRGRGQMRRNASRRRGCRDSFVKQSDKEFPRRIHGAVSL